MDFSRSSRECISSWAKLNANFHSTLSDSLNRKMVVNNPNNWHWVDKNCIDWSKTYFNNRLVGLSSKINDGRNADVTAVSSLEGDVEVCQRKGKVITIFDLRIVLTVEGASANDKQFKGSITIPELAYDTEEDDLQFDISIYNEDSDSEKMRLVVKKELIPQIKAVLLDFGKDLIKEHGSDIQHESDQVNSKFTKENQAVAEKSEAKPAAKNVSVTAAAKPAATQSSASGVPRYNTSTLHLEPTFNTTAEQLYITLLDPQRVSAWTRSNAQIQAVEGSEFLLFGGSISGKILELVTNERIRQAWRLESWRSGHFAELDIQLKQGAGETTMVVKWSGIPIGEEDRVRGNFQDYYERAIKLTFGFGAVL